MFTRLSTAEPKAVLGDIKGIDQRMAAAKASDRNLPPPVIPASSANAGYAGNGMGHSGAPSSASASGSYNNRSIIGNDLTIVGQGLRIITRGTLQVDGRIEGDVVGNEVIIGERGHVTGVVSGESVTVRGEVFGTIKALSVVLQSGAHVDGDVHHRQLSVEQGAHLDGRVRRPEDVSELRPNLDGATT